MSATEHFVIVTWLPKACESRRRAEPQRRQGVATFCVIVHIPALGLKQLFIDREE